MTETRSTCPYCGVGCGVIIESDGAQITGVRGDPAHPANFGRLCSKGSTLHLTARSVVTQQARLLQPLQRRVRGGPTQAIGWDTALQQAAQRLADIIQRHGPAAVGFYISGQLLTEDYYVFNQLARGLIGSPHIDSNSRLCMSSAVAGYKQTLGMDAPPGCYDDVNHAGTIFVAGANPAYAHPVLFRRIEAARQANPAQKLIVVDPRRTDSAAQADLHLAIQPGTDVMLFNGMLHIMLWEGWLDNAFMAAHTSGFEALKITLRDYTPERVADTCGITQQALAQAAQWFAGCSGSAARTPTLSLYCQGLNQSSSGSANNAALINLHLACGHIGKPGAGPLSLTGQPNAMGGREVGAMANLLPGHRDLDNPLHRAEVAALWGVTELPAQSGKTAIEMFQAAADGEIKALWIACTNPAHSLPDQATVRRAVERAEFVLLQEAFAHTATARYADLLLPASSWGEKDGTVTNSERRISRVRAAVAAPGAARADWQIVTDVAQRLELLLPNSPASTRFPYTSPESIWNQHRASTRGRDLDITGMSYAMLEQAPQQWPLKPGQSHGLERLYADGIFPTADGRARFANTHYKAVAEPRQARWPFSLNTGRLRDQWHGMSRTGTLGGLFGHASEPTLALHPHDMERLGLKSGDLVHVTNPRGSILLAAHSSPEQARGQAFLPMHWGDEYLSGLGSTGQRLAGVNTLTSPVFCPDSKQPELKHTAVKILKAELPWSLLAVAWLPEDQVLTIHAALQALLAQFAFASCVPFSDGTPLLAGAGRSGLLLRAAHPQPVADAVLERVEALLQLQGPDLLRYSDKKRGQRRTIRLVEHDRHSALEGFLLAGDTSAQSWIIPLLKESLPAHPYGRALLVPGATPTLPVASRGQQVCSCFNVTDVAITKHLAACPGTPGERLASLQAALKCGTNCGSCLPQVRGMVGA